MSIANLEAMFAKADRIDFEEGLLAYGRYNQVMRGLASYYDFTLPQVVAAFVSLSPNSSYNVNLRSTASVLRGIRERVPVHAITVATYGHCKDRAYAYATGALDFETETKGPKILSFYRNILDPYDTRFVTVDGHMSCVWQGINVPMRKALISLRTYREIKFDITALAFKHYLVPCQMQAVLWFARKRVANVVYDPQLSLFNDRSDVWKTVQDPASIVPYAPRYV